MTDETKIVIRDCEPLDRNLILATWLRGNYYGNSYFRQIFQGIYFKEYSRHIEETLASVGTAVDIACDERNPGWIVGFCVYNDNQLHWIYVKRDFREKGIATLLLKEKKIDTVKSMTKVGRAIADKKGLIFNPF